MAQQVAQLLSLADGLLPQDEEEEEPTRVTLREALKASWGGRSYLERLEAMQSPAAAPVPRFPPVDESPLSRAAAAAAALDDCTFVPSAPQPSKPFGKPPTAPAARAHAVPGSEAAELACLKAQLEELQALVNKETAARRAAEAEAVAARARSDSFIQSVPRLLRELVAELSTAVRGATLEAEASLSLRLRNILDE